jgi:histidinol-phosphate phosphatase family protein
LTPAVFLDRDGTLMEDVGYCGDPAHVRVYAGVPESLLRLRAAGYKLIVVTNQSGIAYGYFTEADYQAVHGEFVRQLRPAGLDGTYHAPDDPKQPTSRRKPAPGMLLEAAREHGIDLARSFMVGDHASDIMAGHAAGVRAIKVMTGHGDHEPDAGADAVVADFSAAVEWILSG